MTALSSTDRYAQTAMASYAADLVPGAVNTARYIAAGMALSQAEQFTSNWNVLAYTASINGFSATLLQDRLTGEKVLAIAGTNGVMDLFTDLIESLLPRAT
jgi:hypothetical protein